LGALEEEGDVIVTNKERRAVRTLIGLVSVTLLAVIPASAADDVRSAIEAANKKWEAIASRGDGPGVAALYTADGQLFPPESDVVRGTEAIGRFLQAVFDSGIAGVSLVTVEVESHGDTAHEAGTLEFLDADGKVLDRGKYIVIWKREDASWKLHRDIWNTSVVSPKP
jgi:uncharacterized protein (TIGR02246 family)